MGTTFACVQCHSHPDPFTHDEYYKFMAFFNDTRDEDTYELSPAAAFYRFHEAGADGTGRLWTTVFFKEEARQWEHFVKTWEPSIHSLTADVIANSALADTKWLTMRKGGGSPPEQGEPAG